MKVLSGMLTSLLSLGLAGGAQAQADWPKGAITLVVPYAPGGYTDAVGRITARYLEGSLAVPVVVENRAGAGGIVGTHYVSRAKPDGHVLCVCSVGAVSVAPLAQKVQYDPLKDLAPISIVSTIPQTVIVRNGLPIRSVADLIAHAKANPGKLTYGSSGAAGLMHYSVALFQVRTGTQLTHVPYKGGAPATLAVVAGEVDLSFTNMTDALPQMEANTVRGIAVTSRERSPFAPSLPTLGEAGVQNLASETWNGIIAPAGTPEPILDRLAKVFAAMAKDEGVVKAMANVGATTVAITPAQYRQQIAQEMKQWSELVNEFKNSSK